MTSSAKYLPGGIKAPNVTIVDPTEAQAPLSIGGVLTPAAIPLYEGVETRTTGVSTHLPTHITTTTFSTVNVTALNPLVYHHQGQRIVITGNVSCTLVNSNPGVNCIEFDGATGTFTNDGDCHGAFVVGANQILAVVLWNGSNYGLVLDERHGYVRNKAWHYWAHHNVGCTYSSGVELAASGTGATASFTCGSGEIDDDKVQNYKG